MANMPSLTEVRFGVVAERSVIVGTLADNSKWWITWRGIDRTEFTSAGFYMNYLFAHMEMAVEQMEKLWRERDKVERGQ